MHTRIFSALTAALIGGLFASEAQAVPVAVSSTVSLPGTTLVAEPNLAGTVLLDNLYSFNQTLTSPTGGPETFVGTVQERVVRETGSGTLDFYWRVMNTGTAGLDANIGDFRVGSFNIPSTPVNLNYRIDGLGSVAPTSAQRFTGSFSNYFNFIFPNGIAPGQSSNFMLAETSATAYTQNASFDLTNIGESQIVFTGVQVSPVPEPTELALMLSGIGLLGFIASRRNKSA